MDLPYRSAMRSFRDYDDLWLLGGRPHFHSEYLSVEQRFGLLDPIRS